MKTVKVLIKRKGKRNLKQIATCEPSNSMSVSFTVNRPNMRLSSRLI